MGPPNRGCVAQRASQYRSVACLRCNSLARARYAKRKHCSGVPVNGCFSSAANTASSCLEQNPVNVDARLTPSRWGRKAGPGRSGLTALGTKDMTCPCSAIRCSLARGRVCAFTGVWLQSCLRVVGTEHRWRDTSCWNAFDSANQEVAPRGSSRQQCLYLLPDPQGHGSFRPILLLRDTK